MKKENVMRNIEIDSVVLHCSTADKEKLNKCMKLLEEIAKQKPVITLAKKRVAAWKIRPGLPVGCKVTLRGKKAEEVLKVILEGVKELSEKQFNPGFLTFGIKEYIQIPSVPYKRELGILGFDVAVTLKRKGFRVKKRKRKRSKIGSSHRISKEETIKFFKDKFNVPVR